MQTFSRVAFFLFLKISRVLSIFLCCISFLNLVYLPSLSEPFFDLLFPNLINLIFKSNNMARLADIKNPLYLYTFNGPETLGGIKKLAISTNHRE